MSAARDAGPPPNPARSGEPARAGVVAEPTMPAGQVSRRRWMRTAAVAGTVVAAGTGLAACSTPTPNASGPARRPTRGSPPATTPSTEAATTPPVTSATTSAVTSTTRSSATPEPPSLTVGAVSAVPVGGGVIYPTHGVVVTQPTSGTFKCFSSSCTHQGCTVNKVAAGLIRCPCHGAKFSIVDGSVKAGPAPRPLTVQEFTIVDGEVVLD